MYVPDEIIPPDHRTDGASAGFHFAVARMEGENFIPAAHYGEIENLAELPAAAVHIAWLAVADQEGHNQFLQEKQVSDPTGIRRTKHFKLIDMGFAFGNPDWAAATLAPATPSYTLPRHMIEKLTSANLRNAIAALKSVSDTSIEQCLTDCPQEWAIQQNDRDAVLERAIRARDDIKNTIFLDNPTIL